MHKVFNFNESLSVFLLLPVVLVSYQRIHCQIQGHEDLLLRFLLQVLWFYLLKLGFGCILS